MKKATHKTIRHQVSDFQQIVNIGPSFERMFDRMGLSSPQELIGNDAVRLYRQICELDQTFHDPCVLDGLLSAVDFMDGKPPRVWWDFTAMRKLEFEPVVDSLRKKYPR